MATRALSTFFTIQMVACLPDMVPESAAAFWCVQTGSGARAYPGVEAVWCLVNEGESIGCSGCLNNVLMAGRSVAAVRNVSLQLSRCSIHVCQRAAQHEHPSMADHALSEQGSYSEPWGFPPAHVHHRLVKPLHVPGSSG